MKKINFNIPIDIVGFQIVDALFAYQQSQNPDYTTPWRYAITDHYDPKADVNVLGLYMPDHDHIDNVDLYDLILLNNSAEPLLVATELMYQWVNTKHNCYMICNSLVSDSHAYKNKVLWWPDPISRVRSYWTQKFYPFLYQNVRNKKLPRDQDLIFINGRNDTWRHHIVDLLKKSGFTATIKSGISNGPTQTNDSFFESPADSEFRVWANTTYEHNNILESVNLKFSHPIHVGVDNKFGQVQQANFILPEYFTHRCVIFPETGWQNDELVVTEKALKCFYAGCLPWPIGGRGINQLYNSIGFYTTWNLLPPDMQEFDHIEDHVTRYQALTRAILWLENHREILQSDQVTHMTKCNKENFFACEVDAKGVQDFLQVLEPIVNRNTQ